MLSSQILVNHERLRFLDARRRDLHLISGTARTEARWACAQAAQLQQDIKHTARNVPLNAVQVFCMREKDNLGRGWHLLLEGVKP